MINQKQKDLLKLIMRSPELPDRWRKVSDTLWPFVKDISSKSDLFELDHDNQYIRITEEGMIVLKYLT